MSKFLRTLSFLSIFFSLGSSLTAYSGTTFEEKEGALGIACSLVDLTVTPLPCTPNGIFYVELDFVPLNTGGEGFTVVGNGNNYGVFDYADLPITLGPLAGDGQTVFEFIVTDLANPNCGAVTGLDPVDCNGGSCDIQGLEYDLIQVLPNGYKLLIDFTHTNTSGTGFDVFYNGQLVVFLDPDDQPADFLLPCDFVSSNTGELTVCDHGNPDCCETIVIELPPCNNACHIFDLIVEPYPCTNGGFLVDLDFGYDNVSGDGFFVVVNDETWGPFSYDDLYLTLGPFEGDGETNYTFHVYDAAHPNCGDSFVLDPIDCGGQGDCSIEITTLEPIEVGNASVLYALEVIGQNTGGLGFDVFYDNEFYGFYTYDQQPVEIILPCAEPGADPWGVLTVCDNDNPNCCHTLEVELIPCFDCYLGELEVEILPCSPNGIFYVLLDFNFFNVGNDGFKVFGNGQSYGVYDYGDLPLEIGPFEGNNNMIYELIVQDLSHPDCSSFVGFGPVDCTEEGDVWPGDANSDNIAHHFDLLNIGIAYGSEGPMRDQVSIDWQAWPAAPWNDQFEENNVNYKHADCNGDGVVNVDDRSAILENYNFLHGNVLPFALVEGDENDPPFFVDLPLASEIVEGEPFVAPIKLGEMGAPVEDIYGIAFTLKFDPDLIDPASVAIEIEPSWLGVEDINLLTIVQKFVEDGMVEIALTRIDQNNVSGFGTIASFIGIIDDVLGKEELSIELIEVKAIMYNEIQIPLYRPVEVVEIVSGTDHTTWTDQIRLYPNPVSEWLYFDMPADLPLSRIEVLDANGRLLLPFDQPTRRISLKTLAPGVYWIKLVVGAQPVYRKVVKF